MAYSSVVEIKKNQYIVEILEEIYHSGAITIAQLARKLHTSVPSITVFINELIDNGWITEVGSSITSSGRRPNLFDLNALKHHIAIIDINKHEVNYCIIDLKNEVTKQETVHLKITQDDLVDLIINNLQNFLKKESVWAIGISAPGLLNSETGYNYTYPMHNREGKSIADIINKNLNLPTFIIQDTQASMLGEHHFGLAKGKRNVLLLNHDWGIGVGILSNGSIIKGADGFAGELGHIQVNPEGELCHCGKKGCLDTEASAMALIKKATKGLKEGKTSTLSLVSEDLKLSDIIDAALKGDEFSIDLIFEIGKLLGKGLSMAIHLFNPETIIIDGNMTRAGELIVSTLYQSINKYCLFDFKKNLQILISPLGESAKILGAKSFVFQKMLENKLY